MKILVIFITKENHINFIPNILILKNYLLPYNTDYACISSFDDFQIYNNIIDLKYKEISSKEQLSKLTDFIISKIDELDYDWFIKIRPEIKLKQEISFNNLSITSINARARCYKGPRRIKYGNSVGNDYKHLNNCSYGFMEKDIVLDEQIFIFHKTILNKFKNIPEDINDLWFFITNYNYSYKTQHEWFHDKYWRSCNINLNIIGINIDLLDINNNVKINSAHLNI
jgi:hypothetical protein